MRKKFSFLQAFLALTALTTVATFMVFSIGHFSARRAYAGAGDALSGFAWSETIGWISFNSTDCDKNGNGYVDTDAITPGCGGADNATTPAYNYGVNVDASGNFSGYAWSENIGWISFNSADLTGCPSGTCSATFNVTTSQVQGWAKALAGSISSGWSGWIKLQSTSGEPSYGVTYNATSRQFQGYAWGSDVVGWISFNCSDPRTGGCGASGAPPNYYVGGNINTAPTVSNLVVIPASSATYCGSPAQPLSWTFSDTQDGSTQTAYQLQVSTSATDFSSPAFDSKMVTTTSTSRSVLVSSSSPLPANYLAFGTTYYWRVQVFDSGGLSSGYVQGPSFATPRHAYPQVAFTWSPISPSVGQITSFTDTTIFASGSTGHAWQWTIPNVVYVPPTSPISENPQVKFTSNQNNVVVLQATDDVGSCSTQNKITSKPPLPNFREVQPQ